MPFIVAACSKGLSWQLDLPRSKRVFSPHLRRLEKFRVLAHVFLRNQSQVLVILSRFLWGSVVTRSRGDVKRSRPLSRAFTNPPPSRKTRLKRVPSNIEGNRPFVCESQEMHTVGVSRAKNVDVN